jgi:hypothetical protein
MMSVGAGIAPADALFGALDGSTVVINESRWRVFVDGIHSEGESRWLQLRLVAGRAQVDVTIEATDMEAIEIRSAVARMLDGLTRQTD